MGNFYEAIYLTFAFCFKINKTYQREKTAKVNEQ